MLHSLKLIRAFSTTPNLGFNRLTQHYPSRQGMKLLIEDLQKRERYASLPFRLKFKYFFTLKKRRFFYMFLMFLLYRYGEKTLNWIKRYRVRTVNKYKRRWIGRYSPQQVFYQSAIEAAYIKP